MNLRFRRICSTKRRADHRGVNPNNTALLFPLEDGMEVLVSRRRLRAEFRARAGHHFLLDGVDGGAGLDGGEFPVLSGRGLFLAGDAGGGLSSGTLAEAVDSGTVAAGNEETGVAGTFGGGRGVDPGSRDC
jgi:hypothetical protein